MTGNSPPSMGPAAEGGIPQPRRSAPCSVLRGAAGQAGADPRRPGGAERLAGGAPREAAPGGGGGGAPAPDPAGPEAGDHAAEEAGAEGGLAAGLRAAGTGMAGADGFCARRSTWRCRGSWPSSACRSRRRSGSCAWSSRSRPSRCAPRCPPSPFPTPRQVPCPSRSCCPAAARSPLTAVFLSPAPGHAHGGWRAVPALWPHKLPRDLQPGRLGGGLPHAHRVHESAGHGRRQPLSQHARGRSR